MKNNYVMTRHDFLRFAGQAGTVLLAGMMGIRCNTSPDVKDSVDATVAESSQPSIRTILEDKFETFNQNIWDTKVVGAGYLDVTSQGLELGLKDTTSAQKYSDSEFWRNGFPFKFNTAKLDLQYENPDKGSSGWGFWNRSLDVRKSEVAYFVYAQGPHDYRANGFWAVTRKRRKRHMIPIKGISLEEPHTYSVQRKKDAVLFSIDGKVVVEQTKDVPQSAMTFAVWIDNAYWTVVGNKNKQVPQKVDGKTALYLNNLKIQG